jgi:creatinine amidohydrolase
MSLPSAVPLAQTTPNRAPRRIKEMRPDEIAAVLNEDPRLILPVGTCEQHGRHLPLGTATIVVDRLADDLSAEFGVLRAPTLEYGVNVGTERGLMGNASLRKKTLHRTLNDLLDTWEAGGVREFVLITAHSHDPHQEALATVVTIEAKVRVVDVYAVPVSDLLDGQLEPMHGDEVDTSLLLYLAPELVSMDLVRDNMMTREQLRRYRRGSLKLPLASNASIGRPSLASADKGRLLYERLRSRISDRIFLAPAPVD